MAKEAGSRRPYGIHPWEFLNSDQCNTAGLVLDADDIAWLARLEVRRSHVPQGVE